MQNKAINYNQSVLFITVVLKGEFVHVLNCDFALVILVKNSSKRGDIGGSGVELFVHRPVQIHQHLARRYCFKHTVLVIIVHVEHFP